MRTAAATAAKDQTMSDDVTQRNRDLIRRAFEGWQLGTANIADTFAPEMVWRIEGRSAASKEYPNKRAFIDEVLVPFAARFAGSREPFRPVRIRATHADGDTVVVLWDGRGLARDGAAYENSYAWFLVVRGGKIVEGTAFFDSIAFNELWSRVQPAGASR